MKKIVIKIGSNIVASGQGGLDLDTINSLSEHVTGLSSSGYEVVIVSSGAVAAGMKKLGLKSKPKEVKLKQAAAAVGQSSLMWAYERGFSRFEKKVAQILLTGEDFSDRKRYINSKNTLLTLLSYGIIPIINENDTVATDEIKFGDNDNLAALVAILIEAERLIILSDVEGLYSEDPRVNPDAQLIVSVDEINPSLERIAGKTRSLVGTGGMYSKVLAAKTATSHGIAVHIISGKNTGLLAAVLSGKQTGTFFRPGTSKLTHRKGWIAYSSRSRGSVVLDQGALKALAEMGRSLLPSGIISVEGDFEVGDSVYCVDEEGTRIAKGLTNYASADIKKIMGQKTSEIEKILGYKYSDEVIHRDNLVLI